MFAAEAGGDGTFFEGVVDCVAILRQANLLAYEVLRWRLDGLVGRNLRRAKVLFENDVHAAKHFGHEEVIAGFVERGFFAFVPAFYTWETEARGWWAGGRGGVVGGC